VELRAVAPLVIAGTRRLVGPCTLVSNGAMTVAFTSYELLRLVSGEQLAVATKLDGSESIPVPSWGPGAYTGLGICALGAPFVVDPRLDVNPLSIGSVCASPDSRGAPSALVTIAPVPGGFARVITPVHADAVGDDEVVARLATPVDLHDAGVTVEGGALFTWFPAEPALGRKSEVLVVAVTYAYRARTYQPRQIPAIGELSGLDDLGRALPYNTAEQEPNLSQVAGEIRDDPSGLVQAVLDDLDDNQ